MAIEPNPFDDAHLIDLRKDQEDPIVQYYIVKNDIVTAGKGMMQVAHAAMMWTLAWEKFDHSQRMIMNPGGADHLKHCLIKKWLNESFRKISKVGKEKDFEKIKNSEELSVFVVKDAGLTEIQQGTETVLVTWPMYRSKTPKIISKLRNFRNHNLRQDEEN